MNLKSDLEVTLGTDHLWKQFSLRISLQTQDVQCVNYIHKNPRPGPQLKHCDKQQQIHLQTGGYYLKHTF